MRRVLMILSLLAIPAGAQPFKMAVVSMAHAHVGGHLATMLKSDKVKFAGIAETSPNLVEQAKRAGVPENLIFSDWKKMIDQVKPDIVWAFTETNRHVEVVEYCAPRGVHVMVEKPLAATYKEALAIQKLARQHNIQVMTNYGSTWSAASYAAKAAVDAGAIGAVYRLRAVVGHNGPGDPRKSAFAAWLADPVQNGGGALMDFGCYSVLWSMWMLGRPESVYATVLHLKPDVYPKVEDNATIILNYKNAVAIFEASWDLPPRPPAGNEIFGRDGSIVIGRTIELRKAGAPRQAPPEEIKPAPLPPERSEPIAYIVGRLSAKQPVEGLSALDLNVEVNEVLEAAKMSVTTGRAVALPLR